MMTASLPLPLALLLLALTVALAAPPAPYDDYSVIVPQKRAALVLDRLLIALQKALQEDGGGASSSRLQRPDRDGPRTAPLRIASIDDDMMALSEESGPTARLQQPPFDLGTTPLQAASIEDDTRGLQRRGQTGGARGRVVLRCYFNAITCF